MPNQIQVKSILAKLLATEDISVEHDAKAPTAAFDVKKQKAISSNVEGHV